MAAKVSFYVCLRARLGANRMFLFRATADTTRVIMQMHRKHVLPILRKFVLPTNPPGSSSMRYVRYEES